MTGEDGAAGPAGGEAAYASYRRRTVRRAAVLLGLTALLLVVFIAALMVGSLRFTPGQVLSALIQPGYDPRIADVVVNLRLPPALLAVLVGGALSLAGVQMQTILDNPLAEPFTLGISAASALGAAVAIVTGLALPIAPGATLAVAAMTTGLAASLSIALISRLPSVTKETTILLGIALVFSCQALLALVQYRASTESLQQIVFWSMGSLMRATWPAVGAAAVALVAATPVFWINGWRLTAISLGRREPPPWASMSRVCARGAWWACPCWLHCPWPSWGSSASWAWWVRTWLGAWWGRTSGSWSPPPFWPGPRC